MYRLLCFALFFFVVGCASDHTITAPEDRGSGWLGSILQDDLEALVANSIDTSGAICILFVNQTTTESIDWDSSYYVPVFTDHLAVAAYAPQISTVVLTSPFVINGTELSSDGQANGDGRTGLRLNFDRGNRTNVFSKPSPDAITGTLKEAKLEFQEAIRFHSLTRGDTIRSDASLSIASNRPGQYQVLSVLVHTPTDSLTTKSIGLAKTSFNKAKIELSRSEIAELAAGHATFILSSTEVRSMRSSNASTILVLATTSHSIEVVIK